MGGLFGNIGAIAGGLIGKKLGNEKLGKQLGAIGGEVAGDAAGFKTGGKVKKTGKALVHKGEYVLPKTVKPTATQRKAVAAIKAKAARNKKKK